MSVPPISADRSSQQVRRGPPGCLSAVLCPAPSARSWPPHRHPWSHRRPQACPSRPVCACASWSSQRSSRSAAIPDSWPVKEVPRWSGERSGYGPPALSNPHILQVIMCLSINMLGLSVGSLHSIREQASHESECLTFLPLRPTSNLDKPVQWWISLAPGGWVLKITADSQRHLHRLLLPSREETWGFELRSSTSCAGRMTWFKGRDRLESCPAEHSACPPSSHCLPLCTLSCCFSILLLSPSLSLQLLLHTHAVTFSKLQSLIKNE